MATTANPFELKQPAPIAPTTNQPSPAAPAITQVAQATPQAVSVTPDQTVESRTQGIIASNSPLMQLAESRAMQQANSRGLINSSLAAGAGQTAVMDAATNIAKQDAATSSNAALTNAKAANDAEMMNTDAINKASTANLGAASNQHLAGIEAQYKQLTQGSSSAASILNNAQQSINAIIANTNLDATAKNKAVADIRANLQNSMNMIGALSGDVDLGSFINQATA